MKKASVIFLFALFPLVMNAQKFTSLNYSVGVPSQDLKDFISEVSFRGVEFSYISFVDSNISIGVSAGWNVFYERRANDSFTYNTITINSTQYRYTNSVPVYFIGNYHFNTKKATTYYAGLGVGTIYTNREVDFGLYVYNVDSWHFGLAPELGMTHELNMKTSFHAGAKYNYAFKTSELDSQSYFTINLGLAWRIW